MNRSENKSIDKKMQWVHKKILVAFFLSCGIIQSAFCVPYTFSLDEIKFNYESGNTNDAITIKKDKDNTITAPEYNYGDFSKNFAYIMGQNNRKIQVRFNSSTDSMHLLINLSVSSGTGIGEVCNLFIENYDTDDWITITLDGSVPNSVSRNDFTWKWDIYVIPINHTGCPRLVTNYTSHIYYTLLDTPQYPMGTPWADVLDKACVWAGGQTTADNAANEITEALYNSGFEYDASGGDPRYDSSPNSFNLTLFVSDLGDAQLVNCTDMAKAVVTYSNAIGCDLGVVLFAADIKVNLIDPIGDDAVETNNPFVSDPIIGYDCRSGVFDFHAFAQNGDKDTWDACLKYDTDSNPDNVSWSNPNCGSTTTDNDFEFPCNESESTYIQRLMDDWYKVDGDAVDCSNRLDCGSFDYDYVNDLTIR